MGNYLSSIQIPNHLGLPKQQIQNSTENKCEQNSTHCAENKCETQSHESSDVIEKNIRQPEIILEFYKSRRNNKFSNLENAIGLK
jgi:hypothetical protein